MRWQRWSAVALWSVILMIVMSTPAGAARPAAYVGEMCWRFVDAGLPMEYSIGTFGLSHEGDGHVSINGRVTGFESGVEVSTEVVSGSAEQIGGELIMNLSIIDDGDGEFVHTAAKVRLDAATLDGTFRAMTIGVSPDGSQYGPVLDQGTAEHLPGCVFP